ncbi:hypothetical protein F5879DRAFT_996354 [Lentinula edodes]|nr:hypothetical protein F5879DRAFT_996354 [Lentinula edodes]
MNRSSGKERERSGEARHDRSVRRKRRENGPIGLANRKRRLLRGGGCWPRQRQLGVRGGPPQKDKGKGKAKAQPVDEDPDDGDDDDDEKEPYERCRTKKISCQMQAGKRSSIICKSCHDAKVRCSYSGRPSTVKREGGSNPTGERLAVLESQVAQLLADNRQLRDGQVKANTYHRHMNRKLDWLVTDAARRRRTPPELPQAGPSELPKKRRRVMDSDEEEDREREKEVEEQGMEEDGERDGRGGTGAG